jgi:hypothetical protein
MSYAMRTLNKSRRENEARVGRPSGKRSIADEIPQPVHLAERFKSTPP